MAEYITYQQENSSKDEQPTLRIQDEHDYHEIAAVANSHRPKDEDTSEER